MQRTRRWDTRRGCPCYSRRCRFSGWCSWCRRGFRFRWWRHYTIRRAILHDRPRSRVGSSGFGILNGVHSSFEDMGFDGDGDLANFSHAILRRIVRLFLNYSFPFRWLRPVFLEYALVGPYLTRPSQGLSQYTTTQPISTHRASQRLR